MNLVVLTDSQRSEVFITLTRLPKRKLEFGHTDNALIIAFVICYSRLEKYWYHVWMDGQLCHH